MKVVRLSAPYEFERLNVTEAPEPGAPGPAEIRVRVLASSLNCHDYAVARGWLSTDPGRIPLSDGAGVVEAVGSAVAEFQVGDHVVSCFAPTWQSGPPIQADFSQTPGDGLDGYAREIVSLPATWFTHAPQGYSHAEAATLPTAGLTAWRALMSEGQLTAGETVLVMGGSSVSIFALQIAKAMGASVIATSFSEAKLEKLKALGADHLINYREYPDWGLQVRELTGGVGVDHVIEVGGPVTMPQSTQAVRVGGRMSLIGVLSAGLGEVPFATLLQRQLRVQGITAGSRTHQLDFIRGIEANRLPPVIGGAFPLEQLGRAFLHEEDGAHFGKTVVAIQA